MCGKRPWKTVTVTTLCRYNPSMNIHRNIAVRAYSSRTYAASHRYGCNKSESWFSLKRHCVAFKIILETLYEANCIKYQQWHLAAKYFKLDAFESGIFYINPITCSPSWREIELSLHATEILFSLKALLRMKGDKFSIA